MIFITVGTQLGFDRLVEAVDSWMAGANAENGFAQIGKGTYEPKQMPWLRSLTAREFRSKVDAATLIVSHAGIGTVLLALEAQKPIIVMPRRAALHEHRNDHQLATAKWLRELTGIVVAEDTTELAEVLGRADLTKPNQFRAEASPELLATIKEFINRR